MFESISHQEPAFVMSCGEPERGPKGSQAQGTRLVFYFDEPEQEKCGKFCLKHPNVARRKTNFYAELGIKFAF